MCTEMLVANMFFAFQRISLEVRFVISLWITADTLWLYIRPSAFFVTPPSVLAWHYLGSWRPFFPHVKNNAQCWNVAPLNEFILLSFFHLNEQTLRFFRQPFVCLFVWFFLGGGLFKANSTHFPSNVQLTEHPLCRWYTVNSSVWDGAQGL